MGCGKLTGEEKVPLESLWLQNSHDERVLLGVSEMLFLVATYGL
jgi:hypothetical protein